MKTAYVIDDRDAIRLPFHQYVDTGAVNAANPVEPVGILHNALLGLALRRITDERYGSVFPNGNRIYDIVTSTVANAHQWDLSCFCVVAEGCPCLDFLAWIRQMFPQQDAERLFPRKYFPDTRPGDELVETRIRTELDGKEATTFLSLWGEVRAALNRIRDASCHVDRFQREMCALEGRVLAAKIDEGARQTLLITTSVARHSMHFALSAGRGASEAPQWVGDDASGAALGALSGSLGGPKGAVAGGLIGAGIFSLATATGWW